MEAYVLDWLNLLVRWAHVIVGIAWIGASFYFIWLDDSLEASKNSALQGELHAIHGGGFYEVQKYRLGPPQMPQTLHWFKWEAYWTFITGFALLVVMYYANAEIYLIDPAVMPLSKPAAIGIGLAWLIGGLVVYEGLCRSPLGKNDAALAAVLFVLFAAAAWGLTKIFSGRGAFIHYGAILGTIMVANVLHVIIPGQRRMVEAIRAGRQPDPKYGLWGKQRSVHNTYFTLPVVFVMISNHYAMTYGHRWAWLVLVGMTLAGALIRVWFVIRHKGRAPAWVLAAGLAVIILMMYLLAPPAAKEIEKVEFAAVKQVMDTRCVACHAERPSFQGFSQPPKGVMLDTPERIQAQALQIHQQAVLAKAMPPGNITAMTPEERALLDRWYRGGANRR
jgi:uncharacterized membrane protein